MVNQVPYDSVYSWNGLKIQLSENDWIYNIDENLNFYVKLLKAGGNFRVYIEEPINASTLDLFKIRDLSKRKYFEVTSTKYELLENGVYDKGNSEVFWQKYLYRENETYYKYIFFYLMFINNDVLYNIEFVARASVFEKREKEILDKINSLEINPDFHKNWDTPLDYWYSDEFPAGTWELKSDAVNEYSRYLRFSRNEFLLYYDGEGEILKKLKLNVTDDHEVMYFMKDGNLEQIKVLEYRPYTLKLEFTAYDGTTRVNSYEIYD